MGTRKLEVVITGDSRSLQRAFGRVSNDSDKLGRRLRGIGRAAAIGTGIAVAAIGALGVKTVRDLARIEKIEAQTAAAIASTGGAANVSAAEIAELAGSLERLSGIEAESIQEGQNLLLTFRNIRNEAGDGNDIFNQTTMALADVSTAMGQDTRTTAIQLGKALNDPVRGLTSLQRVGITFTDAQRDQIKALQESGDTMGAQKIILEELEAQFGGSAEAAGQTFAGMLARLGHAFGEVAETIVAGLMPHLVAFAGWMLDTGIPMIQRFANAVTERWPAIQATAQSVFSAVLGVIRPVFDYFNANRDVLLAVAAGFAAVGAALTTLLVIRQVQAAWIAFNAVFVASPIGLIVLALAAAAAGLVLLYQRSETARRIIDGAFNGIRDTITRVVAIARGLWQRFGSDVTDAFNVVRTVIQRSLATVVAIIQTVLAVIRGDWAAAWDSLQDVVRNAAAAAVAVLSGLPRVVLGIALRIGRSIVTGITNGVQALGARLLQSVTSAIRGLAGAVADAAALLGRAFVDAFVSAAASLPGRLRSLIPGVGSGPRREGVDSAAERGLPGASSDARKSSDSFGGDGILSSRFGTRPPVGSSEGIGRLSSAGDRASRQARLDAEERARAGGKTAEQIRAEGERAYIGARVANITTQRNALRARLRKREGDVRRLLKRRPKANRAGRANINEAIRAANEDIDRILAEDADLFVEARELGADLAELDREAAAVTDEPTSTNTDPSADLSAQLNQANARLGASNSERNVLEDFVRSRTANDFGGVGGVTINIGGSLVREGEAASWMAGLFGGQGNVRASTVPVLV